MGVYSAIETDLTYIHGSTNGLFGSNKANNLDITTATNVATVINAGTNAGSSDGNLNINSSNNLVFESLMYFHHPVWSKLKHILKSKNILTVESTKRNFKIFILASVLSTRSLLLLRATLVLFATLSAYQVADY